MALNAYLSLKGQHQGDITGSVTQKGLKGTIMVISVNHEILTPVADIGSGAPVGKVSHRPFVITKELDQSSTLLYQALVTGEVLTEWKLNFYRADKASAEKNYYSVGLVNAMITDIKFVMPDKKITDLAKLNPYEEIAFVYQKITWTWLDPTLTTSADWGGPLV